MRALLWGLAGIGLVMAAQEYPAPTFLPPAGHPRVYFTAKDLPWLRANAARKQNVAAWEALLQNLKKGTDGVLPKAKNNFDAGVLAIIESLAYDSVLRGDREHGRAVVAHLDAGAFQIDYRGALTTDTGYYQADNRAVSTSNDGSSAYGSAHDFNYNKRSVAHNTILVFDPDEKFTTSRWKDTPLANDGGQRMPKGWAEPKSQAEFLDPASGYRIGEVLGHGFGPDAKRPEYTCLTGDLAKAYSAKVGAYERSFVFLNLGQAEHPAALLVFDRWCRRTRSFARRGCCTDWSGRPSRAIARCSGIRGRGTRGS